MEIITPILVANSVGRAGTALVVAVLALLFLEVGRRVILGHLSRIASATVSPFDDLLIKIVARTKFYSRWGVALWAGLTILNLPVTLDTFLGKVWALLVVIQTGIWGGIVINAAAEGYRPHDRGAGGVVTAAALVVKGTLWTALALAFLDNVGFEVTSLLTGLGVGGVAVALAVQNVFGDILRSLTLLVDRRFEVGDPVTVGLETGRVERVTLHSTRLRTADGVEVIVPNNEVVSTKVRNLRGLPPPPLLIVFRLPLSLPAAELLAVETHARAAVAATPGATFVRAFLVGISDTSAEFELAFSPAPAAVPASAKQAVLLELITRFQAAGWVGVRAA